MKDDMIKINIPFAEQARRETEKYDTEKLDMELDEEYFKIAKERIEALDK